VPQSYLRRTAGDLEALLPTGAGIRLVKGRVQRAARARLPAQGGRGRELPRARPRLLEAHAAGAGVRSVFGTHDRAIIDAILGPHVRKRPAPTAAAEFHLLYGFQRASRRGWSLAGGPVRVLISYGAVLVPWYMRRLAERPANVLFVARSLLAR
jgi:proline dehydrogenase